MERWSGKVAVVTGASSGIGAAICVDLLKAGLIVVGLARRAERVELLRSQVPPAQATNLHVRQCDVSKEPEIRAAIAWTASTLGGVDILVNNAGYSRRMNLLDEDNSEWLQQTLDTNVLAVVWATREAFASMRERQVAGHVVLINSVAGHQVPYVPQASSANLYAPSKYAVTAIAEVLRQEFNTAKSRVKVTSVSPGLVDTEMIPEQLRRSPIARLAAADVAAAVMYAIGTPEHVQVAELKIKPLGEMF